MTQGMGEYGGIGSIPGWGGLSGYGGYGFAPGWSIPAAIMAGAGLPTGWGAMSGGLATMQAIMGGENPIGVLQAFYPGLDEGDIAALRSLQTDPTGRYVYDASGRAIPIEDVAQILASQPWTAEQLAEWTTPAEGVRGTPENPEQLLYDLPWANWYFAQQELAESKAEYGLVGWIPESWAPSVENPAGSVPTMDEAEVRAMAEQRKAQEAIAKRARQAQEEAAKQAAQQAEAEAEAEAERARRAEAESEWERMRRAEMAARGRWAIPRQF